MDEKLQLTQMSQVAMFNGMMEAQIIKSKLESFGIPCMFKYEAVGRVLGLTADGLGRVQVMVPTEDLEKAMEIIRIDDPPWDENDNQGENDTNDENAETGEDDDTNENSDD